MVPFAVETLGRWGSEALDWLRGAVDVVAEVDPHVAAAGHWGKVALLNAWHTRLSVALQKGNASVELQGFKWEICAKDRLLWDSWESKYVAWKDGADGVATT